MDDKVRAVDTAMDDIRGHGISNAGYNRYMGDVVLVEGNPPLERKAMLR